MSAADTANDRRGWGEAFTARENALGKTVEGLELGGGWVYPPFIYSKGGNGKAKEREREMERKTNTYEETPDRR